MGRTSIEWCDFTFNPWIGCQHVSPGCDNCYAETMAARWKWVDWGPGAGRKMTSDANWHKPLAWNRKAQATGERARVFCASLADVFDEWAPAGGRERLWALIRETPVLDWLLLTKRPHSIRRMLPDDWSEGYPNVWLGISAENQAMYDYRWPALAEIPAVVRFVSYEPALGPLELPMGMRLPDWIIAGGESGHGARPADADWFELLRDECALYEIPYFFKQWGDYGNNPLPNARFFDPPRNGKGGALLDGVLHREYPVTRQTETLQESEEWGQCELRL